MKDVIGYEELFSITEDGQIWSKRSSRFLKLNILNGYLAHVTKIGGREGKNVVLKAHRLVAKAYVSNPENKPYVNHKDGDKLNNHVDNLEWCTAKENTQHAYATGLAKAASGTEHSSSKLSEEAILFIRNNYKPYDKEFGARGLGRRFGVSHSVISNVINNKTLKGINLCLLIIIY